MSSSDQDRIIDVASTPVSTPAQSQEAPPKPILTSTIEEETRQWATILHLSTLLGLASFGFGLIAPIAIWQWKKSELPAIDAHGKVVMNAIASYFIYFIIAFILCFVLIGFLLLWVLGLLFVLFPIIAAIKAWHGEVWNYPFCIRFFK